MNSTTPLIKRISETIENIPNGFRAIDKDQLLSDIRDLYDVVNDLEPSAPASVSSPIKENEGYKVHAPSKDPTMMKDAAAPEAASVPEPIVKVEIDRPSSTPVQPLVAEEQSLQIENSADEGTLAGKLNQKPISDLRSGVPLNEKFGFIQKLFLNNASDYGDAILKMNNAQDQSEALEYFDKLSERKQWDVEDVQVKHLRSYIERRHLNSLKANADQ